MRIAVIGRGLSGLAVGWALLQRGGDVTFFDRGPLGCGASGAATGLIHPYAGEQARRSHGATDAMQAAEELFDIADSDAPRPVCIQKGLLRFTAPDALRDAAARYGDVQEIAADTFFLTTGRTIDVPAYLEGLWNACRRRGASYEAEQVSLDRPVAGFDATVFACGHAFLRSRWATAFSLRVTKGQALLLRGTHALERSCIAKGYLAVTHDPEHVVLGSTYEKSWTDETEDLAEAQRLLLPRLPLLDATGAWDVVCAKAGMRLTRRGHYLPYAQRLEHNIWWLGALGSRGLLYHAALGKQLAQEMIA